MSVNITELVCLCPHPAALYLDGQIVLEVPSTGLARVESVPGQSVIPDGGGCPVEIAAPYTYKGVVGLPTLAEMRENPGRHYIVSGMVGAALVATSDSRAEFCLTPDSDKYAVRQNGTTGPVVGTKKLVRVTEFPTYRHR